MLPLSVRKALLRRIILRHDSHMLYLDHIERDGVQLFEAACSFDVEGVVAKQPFTLSSNREA